MNFGKILATEGKIKWQYISLLKQDEKLGYTTLQTSVWDHENAILTTAVLRKVLFKMGNVLKNLYIDHPWSVLNDRTAQIIGRTCPNLQHLKVVGMTTWNWKPVADSCTQLRSLALIACSKLTDKSLEPFFTNAAQLESLTINQNTHITGRFLLKSSKTLKKLSFRSCFNLQAAVMLNAMDNRPNLISLSLDQCPITIWEMVPEILKALTNLEELSLCGYYQNSNALKHDFRFPMKSDYSTSLKDAFSGLKNLKVLHLAGNCCIADDILKTVGQSCSLLHTVNISACNGSNSSECVTDEGIISLASSCPGLSTVIMSYLAKLTDEGICALKECSQLKNLIAQGNPKITDDSLIKLLYSCEELQVLDVCGCDLVSIAVGVSAVDVLQSQITTKRRGLLKLFLAATAVKEEDRNEIPRHPCLVLDVENDHSDPHLKPGYIDQLYSGSDSDMDDMEDDLDEDDYHNFDFYEQFMDEFDLEHLEWGI